ncbi:hypothetical protein BGZ80_007900, partial [Entomortierella chlamydospora]
MLYDRQYESFRKDRDVEKSAELWLKEIQKDGGKTMFLKNQYGDPNNFAIAWNIACMDSTHKVVKKLRPASEASSQVYEAAFLFTLLVKDRYSIAHWLAWLKDACRFRANGFMVDCSVVEHAGIKAVFSDCQLYYCSFHVAQVWERNLRSKGK